MSSEKPAPAVPRRGWRAVAARPELRRGVQAAVIGLVLFFFGLAVVREWPRIVAYDWQLAPGYFLAAAALLLSRAPLQVTGWRLLLARLGYPLSWGTAF